MPIVLRVGPYAFGFYASDRDEPPHVHVKADGKVAKFWIDPVAAVRLGKFRRHELNEIERILAEHREELLESWNAFFGR